jgi:hypothetical protein
MVQIYNKIITNKQNYRKNKKKEKRRNSLSYTSFLMDVYRCLSIIISLPQNPHLEYLLCY